MAKTKPELVLLYPPDIYDFRKKLRLVSPIREFQASPTGAYPIDLAHLGEYLDRNGVTSLVRNLAGDMAKERSFEVPAYIAGQSPLAFLVYLPRTAQLQGALEIARICKQEHPGVPVVMCGFAASYFCRELVELPEVDFIIRGDSPEEPLRMLMDGLRARVQFSEIPNLAYNSRAGSCENPLEYIPASLEHLGTPHNYLVKSTFKYGSLQEMTAALDLSLHPFTEVLVGRGCSHDCINCFNSRGSVEQLQGRKSVTLRSANQIARDVEIISDLTGAAINLRGDLRLGGDDYANETMEILSHLATENAIGFELFDIATRDYYDRLASCIPHFDLSISLLSHDEELRNFCGKSFSNEELEKNISWALESGCGRFNLILLVGLPGQSPELVLESIAYCADLMRRFGPKINPTLQGMVPLLSPGSLVYEEAPRFGNTLFMQSLAEYRQALLALNWRDSLNFETRWMDRQTIQDTIYAALLALNELKARHGLVTHHKADVKERRIRDSVAIIKHMDELGGRGLELMSESEVHKLKHETDIINRAFTLPARMDDLKPTRKQFHYMHILKLALGRT